MEKPSPNEEHGALTSRLIIDIGVYLDTSKEGVLRNEVRHLHVDEVEERVFLPDIHVTLHSSRRGQPAGNPVRVQPDFAIEVLSPDDRIGRVLRRAAFYMRAGTRLLWLVDADTETITVYRPGEPPFEARPGDMLDAKPVLRDFHLDVARLFAVLHEDDVTA